jgi:enterochelin esterase family protein
MQRRSGPFQEIAAACAALCFAVAVEAQPPARPPTPNDSLISPRVAADGHVTISIYAPKASEVGVIGDWQAVFAPVALQKSAEGVWSIEVGPLPADFYSYGLVVDGVETLDPKNPMIKQGVAGVDNMFMVPGEGIEFADNQTVPHGTIRQVWYESSTLGMQRRMHVYTPPGYDDSEDSYPVLYLLHGGGDEDSGWSTIGRAGFVLDNLLAADKAVPMIIVMPNGSLPAPAGSSGFPDFVAAQARFVPELMDNVIPFVESNFRVRTNPDDRALAGLSMGGIQTTQVFTRNPDEFGYIAIWSAGLFGQSPEDFSAQNSDFLAQARAINRDVELLTIVVGEDDFARAGSEALAAVLEEHGIDNELTLTSGGHTWINWRRYLNELAPRLFR